MREEKKEPKTNTKGESLRKEVLDFINSASPGSRLTREQFLGSYIRCNGMNNKERNRKLSELDIILTQFVHDGLLETGYRIGAYKIWTKRNRFTV